MEGSKYFTIQEKIDYILKMQTYLSDLCSDKKKLFEKINSLSSNKKYLNEIANELYSEYPKTKKNRDTKNTGTLKFLQMTIVQMLLKNELIDEKKIDEIKETYINNSKFFIQYFPESKYSSILQDVANYSKNNPFANWKKPQNILRRLLYNKTEFDRINLYLKEISNKIFSDCGFDKSLFKQNKDGFLGNQGYGRDVPVIVLFDKRFEKQASALQICLYFKNNKIDAYIQLGKDENYKHEKLITDTNQYDKLVQEIKNNKESFVNLTSERLKLITSTTLKENNMQNIPLNQILYGPPGTGKTYNTVIEAMKIIGLKNLFSEWFLKTSKAQNKEKVLNYYLSYSDKIIKHYNINIFQVLDTNDFIKKKKIIISDNYYKINLAHTETSSGASYTDSLLNWYEKFLNNLNYEKLQLEFDKLKQAGQIEFVTFHQSYSYEEFVEGIKPYISKWGTIDNNDLSYVGENGIFKNICNRAKPITDTIAKRKPIDFSNTKVFKMSLGNTMEKEDDIYNYCIENNVVSLGFKDVDFSNCKTSQDFKRLDNSWGATALERFVNWMDVGDIVIISNGNRNFRAIAQIKSDYFYDKNTPISYTHFRKVEWLYKGKDIYYSKINDKIFSQQSIYGYYYTSKKGQPDYNPDLKTNELNKIITGEINKEPIEPYILIIDEINRGNISKIFGELITLIENDKRENLTVTLPYSQEIFTVPRNLYIIGTMNTSDRSIAAIDIALRRRFKFKEIMPNSDLVADFGCNFKKYFEVMNKRITILLDRDHQIGHSYFINTTYKDDNNNNNPETLKKIWFQEIIPLLNEYFYGDWDKLQALLGKAGTNNTSFINEIGDVKFANDYSCDNDDKYDFCAEAKCNFEIALKNAFEVK